MASVITIGCALSFLAGCGNANGSSGTSSDSTNSSTSSVAPRQGGNLTIGLDREVQTLDIASSITTQQPLLILSTAVYEPLMKAGKDGSVEPDMAKSLTSDATATQWKLTLRDGLKFSDGTPLTSKEVVAHIKRLGDPATKSSAMAQVAQIKQMDTPDAATVTFALARPNADFAAQFTRALGMIESTTAKDPFGFPLGAGPYQVSDFTPGSSVKLTKNANYWGDKPYLDTVTYKMIPDADSRFQSLKSGDIDLMWSESASQFQEAAKDSSLKVMKAPASMSMVLLNLKDAQLADASVRKALAQAIDRKALNAVVNLGEGKPIDNPYALLGGVAPKDANYPQYDLNAAKSVLESKHIKLTLNCENRPDTVQRATALKDMLGKAGVDITVTPVESANYTSQLMSGKFQMADFVTSVLSDPSGAQYLFTSKGPYNFTGYANTTVDSAIAAASATTDESKRAAAFATASKALGKDVPVLWTTATNAGFIMSNKIAAFPDISHNTLIEAQAGKIALGEGH
ncbi:ABC transporter substrate-binding protein [Bifidobacterium tibiigranuli]|jgi:peptide/nickel transport system substrate-binding protein|uniref:ABC transporter substrate-binding protein n=1 Tax=Bifidobacterium tibiigranuli TaxID=2172043 RepID=UPI0023547726|nr:ABC transporter substrate-binding protein [Bifidobacterium tibiigranuli]MCH3975470.1 ABC transporter substrate-binding protein [Bifidobacterium tibiigranuli]MCH4190557.1 ABC transporter substrate-binding protein [Bifidobacterium tibiigranuli]MCH4204171.1 ABC transporter substrate-binding protein [Bifidobacterium tibiigranuli]MCH4274632.1 ABC transporter substrate-binding protein [Bifidobacterium tibiigranuli]MCI1210465.1 ABC transporter substrate-binding protein [Bifidobacterium tibiigranul